jgi:PEP-CTERM motif
VSAHSVHFGEDIVMARIIRVGSAVIAALTLTTVAPPQETWNGLTTDWNTASNWNPAVVPNSAALTAATSFDISGFLNPIQGTFSWNLNPENHQLSLTYTPTSVPEPSALVLLGAAAAAASFRRLRCP